MHTPHRTQRRTGRLVLGVALSCALIAAACSSKKNDSTQTVTSTTPGAATTPAATTAVATTTAGSAAGTTAGTTAVTDAATTAAPTTAAAEKPVLGGKLIVSGEAKVGSPWLPAKFLGDEYAQMRARTFLDPIAAIGADLKVHPYLAESIKPNADYSVWTVKLRSGITFTDGTPLNADAVIQNLQATGTGLLVSGLLIDVAKNADKSLKIVKTDDSTFDIYMGKGGDAAKPFAWVDFDRALASQWGLIGSPAWLDAAKADPTKETAPVGSGPFMVASFSDDLLVVKKNPKYWQKDKDGVQLPYLDEIDFKVIPDGANAEKALEAGDIDLFATSNANVIKTFRDNAAKFPMSEQTKFQETNYLLIDLDKKTEPTTDSRVRCALSMSIDRTEIIAATGGGIEKPANGLFSEGQQGYLTDNGFKTDQDVAGAKALIDAYKKDKGVSSVTVQLETTPTSAQATLSELLKGYWTAIGVDTKVTTVEQSAFIGTALTGSDKFHMFSWRQHAGATVDEQHVWWSSDGSHPDKQLSLNFARLSDPVIDKNLDIARSATDPAVAKAAAEEINKQFAKECYNIPLTSTLWGLPHKPSVMGLGETVYPDGALSQDGAGFPGSFWVNALWIKK